MLDLSTRELKKLGGDVQPRFCMFRISMTANRLPFAPSGLVLCGLLLSGGALLSPRPAAAEAFSVPLGLLVKVRGAVLERAHPHVRWVQAHAVRSLAIREGLNLKRCTAYSDSYNDVPLLSLVGTAVAINPDAALRDYARKRGWEIRDFRTARKAARIGVPSALALGAAGGALAAVASRRQSR